MGLFSGKKKTYVSSSVWNLAGDIKDRADYLKTTVLGSVLLDTPKSTGESIISSYINGPGIGLRRYASWAKGPSNYNNDVGFVGGGLSFGSAIDPTVLSAEIPRAQNEFIIINEYDIGLADSDWWAEKYMVDNHQDLLFTAWESEYDSTTNAITIRFVDTTTVTFAVPDFDSTSRYIISLYRAIKGGTTGPIIEGTRISVNSESEFPPAPSGYSLYSIDETLTSKKTVYHKYTLVDYATSTRDLYVQEVNGLPPLTEYSYHFDTQTVANDSVSPYRYFMYKQGSGNTVLDSFFATPEASGQYLPFIPIRANNSFIRDISPNVYNKTRRAFSKAMSGSKLDKVLDQISTNSQLGDLDYIYVVYGTSLNSPDNSARGYIYQFFSDALRNSADSAVRFAEWEAKWAEADASMTAYLEWESSGYNDGSIPPPIIPYPKLPVISVDVKSTSEWLNFHMAIEFNGIFSESGSGLIGDHKVGDYWIESRPPKKYRKQYSSSSGGDDSIAYDVIVERLAIMYQSSPTHWESIEVYGLVHKNYVYDGKWVVISGSSALSDPEESGFIIPIHEQTFKEMSLVSSTQLASVSCYLVFNCYKEVKQKWYQTGFFKVLLVAVVITVSIVFAPAGTGATGVLGSSATVGAAAGFTGTAAIVAGTVANALAAIVITKALTAAFGDKLGPILGSVVTITLTAYGGIGGDFSNFDAGSLMTELGKANNLISLTDGLVKSVSAFMNEKTVKIMEETQRMMEQYKQDMLEVAKQYEEMFGTDGKGVIDPLLYTHAGYTGIGESSEAYIERTLMCGSDIAEMTQSLISNFTKTTLSLELPS